MGPAGSRLIWRAVAALFLGAIVVVGVTSVSSPAGDVIPARIAINSSAQEPDTDEADRPTGEQAEGLSRMVGVPGEVDVEVLSEAESTGEATVDADADGAAEVGQTEPASQVVATPRFTG